MQQLLPEHDGPAERIDWHTLFQHCTGMDLRTAGAGDIRRLAEGYGIVVPQDNPDQGLVEILFDLATEAWLRERKGVVVSHFPAAQASLAMLSQEDPGVALRFEYYYGGIELANGFRELADPDEQMRRFEVENSKREKAGKQRMPIDRHFIAALAHGLPDCSGVAAGVDRILMLRNSRQQLSDVLPFPLSLT
jgi:lysyl-tRNA synthetase class 2